MPRRASNRDAERTIWLTASTSVSFARSAGSIRRACGEAKMSRIDDLETRIDSLNDLVTEMAEHLTKEHEARPALMEFVHAAQESGKVNSDILLELISDRFVLCNLVARLGMLLTVHNKDQISPKTLLKLANRLFDEMPPKLRTAAATSIDIVSTQWQRLDEQTAGLAPVSWTIEGLE
jgi:hypothetical protein